MMLKADFVRVFDHAHRAMPCEGPCEENPCGMWEIGNGREVITTTQKGHYLSGEERLAQSYPGKRELGEWVRSKPRNS